jgi:hypothetical protein
MESNANINERYLECHRLSKDLEAEGHKLTLALENLGLTRQHVQVESFSHFSLKEKAGSQESSYLRYLTQAKIRLSTVKQELANINSQPTKHKIDRP